MELNIYHIERQIQHTWEIIGKSKIPTENKQDLEKFYNYLTAQGIKNKRLLKCLQIMFWISRDYIKKPYRDVSTPDMEAIIAAINQTRWAEWTKRDYKVIIRIFYRWLYFGNNKKRFPEIVEWIPIKIGKSTEKVPEELLSEADIKIMVDNAICLRDRALIGCLYESGCRVAELLGMRIKDIAFDSMGAVIKVTGKTGFRNVRCDRYSIILQDWLNNHPQRDNKEAYVWCSVSTSKPTIAYDGVCKMLKRCAAKAGIKKRIHPHTFRHSRASVLANFFTDAQMKVYFGWSGDSKMASVYIHLSAKNIDDAFKKLYGLSDAKDNTPKPAAHKCPRCNSMNSIDAERCHICNLPMTEEVRISDQIQQENLNGLAEINSLILMELLEHLDKQGFNYREAIYNKLQVKGFGNRLQMLLGK